MHIVTLGIDLAKNVFALRGVDAAGKPVLARPSVARAKLAEVVASLLPCLIGTETCTGAHHWAGCLSDRSGHAFALPPAQHMRPCVRRYQTDRTEPAGLLEADRCGGSPRLPVTAPDRRRTPGFASPQ